MSIRHLEGIIRQVPTSDGDGVKIKRVPMFDQPLTDPFLMMDQISSDNPNDYIGGFPSHPHRGMETLTYLRHGSLEHQDHLGNKGMIHSGGAQWMSAGRGIIHSEMPAREMDELFGFQLWINLPAAQKMQPPQYRDVPASDIPVIRTDKALVKGVAGQWQVDGQPLTGALMNMAAEAGYLDVELAAGGQVTLASQAQQRVLVMLYGGQLDAHTQATAGHLLIYGMGETLVLSSEQGAKFIVLSGTPIKEKIVHYGPFVMNTYEEIEQAITDYNNGKF